MSYICGANTYTHIVLPILYKSFIPSKEKHLSSLYQLLFNRAIDYNLLFPITVVQSKSKTTVVLTTGDDCGVVEKILNLYKLEIQFK